MSSLDMLVRCVQHQPASTLEEYWYEEARDQPHRCSPDDFAWPGPNLVIWNGRAHAPVLQLKDAF